MAARQRLAELQEKKRAADKGYGPPFTPAQQAAFRLLTLLYPPSPNPWRQQRNAGSILGGHHPSPQ